MQRRREKARGKHARSGHARRSSVLTPPDKGIVHSSDQARRITLRLLGIPPRTRGMEMLFTTLAIKVLKEEATIRIHSMVYVLVDLYCYRVVT